MHNRRTHSEDQRSDALRLYVEVGPAEAGGRLGFCASVALGDLSGVDGGHGVGTVSPYSVGLADVDTYARTLLSETREELARADDKATTLLGVNGILIAAVIAGVIAGDFSASDLSSWREPLFWLGAAAVLAAEALLCAAVFPQVSHSREAPVPPRYFGHVARIASRQNLREALAHEEDATDRTVDELFVLSRSAVLKYRLIAAAQVALAGGVLACAVAALVDGA